MLFEWDDEKNRANRQKHDVSFETATLVFDDPFALTQRDVTSIDEERFITLGEVGPEAILFVVHLSYESEGGQEAVRIISARPATARERKSYEEAHKRPEARDRGHRRQKRSRH